MTWTNLIFAVGGGILAVFLVWLSIVTTPRDWP